MYTEKERPQDLVKKIAVNLRFYPINEILSAPLLVSKFDAQPIKSLLSHLVPENLRFV